MKILTIGPYLGDLKNELFQFLPYARWLTEIIEYDKVYLSTHINRSFLYDFIPEENIIPVYQQFSRDEKNQKDYIHKKLNKRDYRLIIKTFKEKIIERENCARRDIEMYNLPYTKTSPQCNIHNKRFDEIHDIEFEIPEEHKNKIIFIPSKEEVFKKSSHIYKWLKNNYDIVVIGNTNTWLHNDNFILNKIDYFENGLKYCIKYIMNSKCVICPSSYWTFICNLQKKNVFSWGEDISLYKKNGIYNFENNNCFTIPSDKNTDINVIIKSMNFFLKKQMKM